MFPSNYCPRVLVRTPEEQTIDTVPFPHLQPKSNGSLTPSLSPTWDPPWPSLRCTTLLSFVVSCIPITSITVLAYYSLSALIGSSHLHKFANKKRVGELLKWTRVRENVETSRKDFPASPNMMTFWFLSCVWRNKTSETLETLSGRRQCEPRQDREKTGPLQVRSRAVNVRVQEWQVALYRLTPLALFRRD